MTVSDEIVPLNGWKDLNDEDAEQAIYAAEAALPGRVPTHHPRTCGPCADCAEFLREQRCFIPVGIILTPQGKNLDGLHDPFSTLPQDQWRKRMLKARDRKSQKLPFLDCEEHEPYLAPTSERLRRHAVRFGHELVAQTAAAFGAKLHVKAPKKALPKRKRHTTDELRTQVHELRKRGLIPMAIADTLNISDSRVRALLQETSGAR